jgi:hypothetical protein
MGRNKLGIEEKKTPTAVRLKPSHKELVCRGYGSVQKFVDEKIKEELEGAHTVKIRRAKKAPEKISPEDF